MTQQEAISLLRRYRRDAHRFNPKCVFFPRINCYAHVRYIYGPFLIDEMIRKIRHSEEDPIDIVSHIYSKLNEVLGDSDDDHFITHAFASLVELEAGDILRYLRNIEKEKNEDAKNKLERNC